MCFRSKKKSKRCFSNTALDLLKSSLTKSEHYHPELCREYKSFWLKQSFFLGSCDTCAKLRSESVRFQYNFKYRHTLPLYFHVRSRRQIRISLRPPFFFAMWARLWGNKMQKPSINVSCWHVRCFQMMNMSIIRIIFSTREVENESARTWLKIQIILLVFAFKKNIFMHVYVSKVQRYSEWADTNSARVTAEIVHLWELSSLDCI